MKSTKRDAGGGSSPNASGVGLGGANASDSRRTARFSEQQTSKHVASAGLRSAHIGATDGHDGEDVTSLISKISLLERDLERRQESYVSRERAYKTRIDELEEELVNQRQGKTGWMKADSKMSQLKSMQNQILNNVELVQDRTSRILQEQERSFASISSPFV